ncbi:MAG: hypothetical protein RDU25_05500 [Patescibacteria group bacterium]|nr:hypothetical protein [Patescibacteria group bacterium]
MAIGRFEKAKRDFVVTAKANINRAKRGFSPIEPAMSAAVDTVLAGQKHWPYLAAKGGEHLVFSFDDPRLQGIVYKVNYFESLPLLTAWYEGEDAMERKLDLMREEMDQRTAKLNQMRDYFGFNAVPPQRFVIKKLPVTDSLIMALKAERLVQGMDLPKELPVWTCVQRKIKKPEGQTYSLNGYYPESKVKFGRSWSREDIETYDAAHDVLFGGPLSELDQASQEKWVLLEYPELLPLWQAKIGDPVFKKELQQVVKKLIAYTQETGELMELAGAENLVLLKEKAGWQVKLFDALPMKGVSMESLRGITAKLKSGRSLTLQQRYVAMNGLNTLRFINALALIAEVPERMVEPDVMAVPAETWRQEIAKIFVDKA